MSTKPRDQTAASIILDAVAVSSIAADMATALDTKGAVFGKSATHRMVQWVRVADKLRLVAVTIDMRGTE